MRKVFRSSINVKLLLGCYLALPAVFLLIPRHWIREGSTICLYRNLLSHECWGCGMTRALHALVHLDFAAAWEYNRMVVIVAPLLLYLYVDELLKLKKRL